MLLLLPSELLYAVLGFLSVPELKIFRFVHRRFAYLGFPLLTEKIFTSDYCPKAIQSLVASPFGSLNQTKELTIYHGGWKSFGRCSSPDVCWSFLVQSLPSLQSVELSHIFLRGYPPQSARILFPLYPIGKAFTLLARLINESNNIREVKATGVLDIRNVKIEQKVFGVTSLHINALYLGGHAPQFLDFFPDLEHLSLRSTQYCLSSKSLRLSKLHWGGLKRLELCDFWISEDDLLGCVMGHKLLEELKLENICLTAGSWNSICLRLRAFKITIKFLGNFANNRHQGLGPMIPGRDLEQFLLESRFLEPKICSP